MRITSELALSPLWRIRPELLSVEERVQLSYRRCKSVVELYKLTKDDILDISPRYWEFHTDPILAMDTSVATLLTIHYNLCAGTLATYAAKRPDIAEILEEILSYKLSGQYCLTELGHGLDAMNLETTATLLLNGEFEINTPVQSAAKYMPPTSPNGTPTVAVVFARLLVGSDDRGIKPFVVHLNDGVQMYPGIFCKVLPPRGGARPIKHALTYFDRVRLPATALLGSLERAQDARAAFFENIYRVICGSLSMGGVGLPAMQLSLYVAGKYSMRRKVIDTWTKLPRSIFSFSTQYRPVLAAISQTLVMGAFANSARDMFTAAKDIYTKHLIAAILKITLMRFAHSTVLELGDRCGAQGLSEVNQLSVMHSDLRGAAIAEGDTLTLSNRFGMEILLGRLTPPPPLYTDSLVFKHEASIAAELRAILLQFSNHHDPDIERQILPQCQPFIEAIGHRIAYDSAVKAGLDSRIINTFVASVIQLDPAWYVEQGGMSRGDLARFEVDSATALLPIFEELLEALDVREYVTAPIISDQEWDGFVNSLPTLGHGVSSTATTSRL